jgi:hypothetical protein
MTFTVRQMIGAVVVSFSIGALVMPVATQGGGQSNAPSAAANQPKFMMVEFMKLEPGKENDWVKLERETWKPMHEMRVKDGSILSWAAINQVMPGDESNGPVAATVTTFRGWPDPTKIDWVGLIKRAHPQTQPDTIFNQAESARKIVRSEIWQVIDQTATASSGTK